MSTKSGRCVTWMALGFLAAAGIGICARAADAAVGKVLWTVNIPDAAKCQTISAGTRSGTAVAVVPGGKLNFPKFPSLLVTSCVEEVLVQPNQAKLFFLDPSTNPTATLVATMNTTVTPTAGWESLALRSDEIDLIGCGMVGNVPTVHKIDFSKIAPNTVTDGTAAPLFTGPEGSTCQGLAWDVTSKTIYESSSGVLPNVLHLTKLGANSTPATVASGCPGPMTGAAVGVASAETPAFSGPVLFVACPQGVESPPELRQITRETTPTATRCPPPNSRLAPSSCLTHPTCRFRSPGTSSATL